MCYYILHPVLLMYVLSCKHLFLYYLYLIEGDETGVMDSLMEALQSGAAFRDRRKRTPRNGKANHFLCPNLIVSVTYLPPLVVHNSNAIYLALVCHTK